MSMARTPNIEQLRQRIAALTAERSALTSAPRSHAETRADVERWCAAQATIGDGRIGHHVKGVAHSGDLNDVFKVSAITGAPRGHAGAMPAPIDLAPMLASVLGPVALAEILGRHLPADDNGVTAADRRARIVEIEAELFEAECAEERLIEASEAAGAPIARRADMDPRAVLGLHE